MHKITAALTLLLFCSFTAFSQHKTKNERFYFWTTDWRITQNVDSAAYLSQMKQINDTCWQMDTWHFAGPSREKCRFNFS